MSEARKYFIWSILITAVLSISSWLPMFHIDPEWFHFWLVEAFQRFLPIIAIIVGLRCGWLAHERTVNPRKSWFQRRRDAAEVERRRKAKVERENAERMRMFREAHPLTRQAVYIMYRDGRFEGMTESQFRNFELETWAEYETISADLPTNEIEIRAFLSPGTKMMLDEHPELLEAFQEADLEVERSNDDGHHGSNQGRGGVDPCRN